MRPTIKLTQDTKTCPACSNHLTAMSERERECRTCGVLCRIVTDETIKTDEQLKAATRRAYAEKHNGARDIIGGFRW